MKVVKDILDEETLRLCQEEIGNKTKERVWGISKLEWHLQLHVGISGIVGMTEVSPSLKERVEACIKPYLPPYDNLMVQHYLWHPHSGINMHDDANQIAGMTVYLNQEWRIEWGGMLVADNGQDLDMYYPNFNSAVINDSNQWHMVTTLSGSVPFPRHTLQIWCK